MKNLNINLNNYFYYDESSPTCLRYNYNTSNNKSKKGKHTGTSTGNNYYKVCVMIEGKKKYLQAHNVVWWLHNGDIPKGYIIDHINHVKTDNRISNLRLVTESENQWNKVQVKDSGLPKGIIKTCSGYQGRINKHGKHHSKHFSTIEQAIEWLDEKRAELHGEYACF